MVRLGVVLLSGLVDPVVKSLLPCQPMSEMRSSTAAPRSDCSWKESEEPNKEGPREFRRTKAETCKAEAEVFEIARAVTDTRSKGPAARAEGSGGPKDGGSKPKEARPINAFQPLSGTDVGARHVAVTRCRGPTADDVTMGSSEDSFGDIEVAIKDGP